MKMRSQTAEGKGQERGVGVGSAASPAPEVAQRHASSDSSTAVPLRFPLSPLFHLGF